VVPVTNEHSKQILECARRSAGLDVGHLSLLANTNRSALYRRIEAAFWVLVIMLYYCPDAAARFLTEIEIHARVLRDEHSTRAG